MFDVLKPVVHQNEIETPKIIEVSRDTRRSLLGTVILNA